MNTIDRTKKLLLVLWNGNYDHAFICSDKVGYYDKGDRHEKEIAKHLSKPGTQVVFLSDNTEHDDTEIIFDEYLPNIIEGKNSPDDYGFEVTSVFNTLGEWAGEDEDEDEDEELDE